MYYCLRKDNVSNFALFTLIFHVQFFQRGNHLLCMQMQCQSSAPLKFDHSLHEQNKLLHEEKIAAQQQKMGGRATYDQHEGNRLSLLAQEDAAASGIPTMMPPKPAAIHLPNSQKRVPTTGNLDLDDAIRRQKAMLAADEAQLLGNSLDHPASSLTSTCITSGNNGCWSGIRPRI